MTELVTVFKTQIRLVSKSVKSVMGSVSQLRCTGTGELLVKNSLFCKSKQVRSSTVVQKHSIENSARGKNPSSAHIIEATPVQLKTSS
jgi:hypothetical protein